MPEVVRVVEAWNIGRVVRDSSPSGIIEAVDAVLARPSSEWRAVCAEAAAALHWGTEERQIVKALEQAQSAF